MYWSSFGKGCRPLDVACNLEKSLPTEAVSEVRVQMECLYSRDDHIYFQDAFSVKYDKCFNIECPLDSNTIAMYQATSVPQCETQLRCKEDTTECNLIDIFSRQNLPWSTMNESCLITIAVWPLRRFKNSNHLGYLFCFFAAAILLLACAVNANAEEPALSQKMADFAMQKWPNGPLEPKAPGSVWNYELGTLLNGFDAIWYGTADGVYYKYIKQSIDQLVEPDGSIPTYKLEAYSLDNILLGKQLLLLYGVTRDVKYYKAASQLRKQLTSHPRTASGGYWHKQIYPDQMWLDGLYMAEPFYAEYASSFKEPEDFADIAKQFVLIEQRTRDPKTGLLVHAWDESKKQDWADKKSGRSPSFWARGIGWYMMALVDTLPYFPQNDPGRSSLLAILNRTAESVVRYQDANSGLWYQVLDKGSEKGNYFESSAACMFTYALAKGVRLGYLPNRYATNATRAYQGIQKHFVHGQADGSLELTSTVKGIGLGGNPYRDGSYSYYISSPMVSNDPKGIGAFILAGAEMDMAPYAQLGHGSTVLVDAWFNSQQRTNAAGQAEYFHYKWNDFSNDGFSLFGHIFESYGVKTGTLSSAPTVENLKNAQFYVIVSPDIPVKNPHPNYVQPGDAEQVTKWVRDGGFLIIMENDSANADLDHLNLLSDKFRMHFNAVLSHHVIGSQYEMGRIAVSGGGTLFHKSHTLYMKDTSTLSLSGPAVALLQDKNDILMATVKYGNGQVFAVVDPWLYNEYTDGRKLPPEYDNYAGGRELVNWLLQQQSHSTH